MGEDLVTYEFEDDGENFELEVFIHGMRVGWARGTRHGDRLHFADIHVNAEGPRPWPSLPWFIRKRFRPKRLRRTGIGRDLLNEYLRRADAADIREIWGSVTKQGLSEHPFLLRWYEKHGFVVTEADAECLKGLPNALKKVVRRR
jgi:GNAT superfamily N-acetyltransferase